MGRITIKEPVHDLLLVGIFLLGIFGILASGGGGGSGSGSGDDDVVSTTWLPGVFLDAVTYFGQCANPRVGINPFTNQPFSDIQGSITDENNFLRSYSNDTYLWYDEITDRDPSLYNDPVVYFGLLKTTAFTSTGQPKDKFHFTIPSDEWFQLSQSGVSSGYGATFILLSSIPPREVVVAYTEPNSPATDPLVNISRGARVLSIDGVDINDNTQSGIDILNAGLFPDAAGETHVFQILDLGAPQGRMVTITSANITSMPVREVTVLNTISGRVGYLVFNDHIATAEAALINAVNQLNSGLGIDDLVLDLRYNGGGFLDIASELAYMIAGPVPTAGQSFETLEFNNKHPITNPVTGQPISPTPFYDSAQGFSAPFGQMLPTLNLPRVFVLTGPGTCSASESIMNSLRGVNVEVIQIGSTTCGKPFGFYPTDNCGTTYFTIQFRGVNAVNYGDYTDGFSPQNTVSNAGVLVPGCSVADDFAASLGDPAEGRLAAALIYRDTQTCPFPSGISIPGELKSERDLSTADGIVLKNPWLTNRILQ